MTVNSSVCVVGTDATMVYDAVHNVIADALGDLDPSFALQDFTAKDVTSAGGESVAPRVLEALNTPPFLVERRVVVVRDAQSLSPTRSPTLLDVDGRARARRSRWCWRSWAPRANKLVKAAGEVVEVNVGSRTADRVTFVEAKLAEYSRDASITRRRLKLTDQAGRRRGARRRTGADPPVDLRNGAAQLRATSSRTSATPATCPSGT